MVFLKDVNTRMHSIDQIDSKDIDNVKKKKDNKMLFFKLLSLS